MRDLWAEYVLEREGVTTLRDGDLGFITYVINGDECYIQDIHVAPEYRKTGVGSKLHAAVTNIAKARGCKYLTGTVYKGSNGITVSTLATLKAGFEIHSWTDEKIVFFRSIE